MVGIQHVDVATGVDFEIARDILGDDAARAYRLFVNAKTNPNLDETEVERRREDYRQAKAAYRGLAPTDTVAIRELVGGAAR